MLDPQADARIFDPEYDILVANRPLRISGVKYNVGDQIPAQEVGPDLGARLLRTRFADMIPGGLKVSSERTVGVTGSRKSPRKAAKKKVTKKKVAKKKVAKRKA
jgi:hypothetical protein